MFATLIGPYPTTADPADVIAELASVGLEPVSDGRGAVLVSDAETGSEVVATWQAAAASTAVAVKQSLLGPFSAAHRLGVSSSAMAEAIGAAVSGLAGAGCPLIEIEEPDAVIAASGDEGLRLEFTADLGRLTDAARRGAPPVARHDRRQRRRPRRGARCSTCRSPAMRSTSSPDPTTGGSSPRRRAIGASSAARWTRRATADDRPEPLVWAAHYAASTGGRGLARVGLANASSLAALTPRAGARARSRRSPRRPGWRR